RRLLARAADERKDQSYMLARVDPGMLRRVWFPLGERHKDEVRAEAAEAGLAAAGRAESQEACFLAGDDYRDFLARRGLRAASGPIVDRSGAQIGSHEGYWHYTPGQRRGLRIASGRPLYTVGTDAATNTVVVGPREELGRTSLTAIGGLYARVERAEAKIRYRSPAVPGTVAPTDGGFALELDEPVYSAAPG